MKKIIISSAISLIATSANAATDNWPYWYLGLNAGVVMTNANDWESSASSGDFGAQSAAAYSATLGYAPSDVRYELEFGGSEQDIGEGTSTGNVRVYRVAANAIYDFTPEETISPYLGAGAGIAKVSVSPSNNPSIDGSDQFPIYQLQAGITYGPQSVPLTKFNLGYKYVGAFKKPEIDNTEFEYNGHIIEAGARFRF